MVYYSTFKKKEILLFATTWMKLVSISGSELSQTFARQTPCDFICAWNLRKSHLEEADNLMVMDYGDIGQKNKISLR